MNDIKNIIIHSANAAGHGCVEMLAAPAAKVGRGLGGIFLAMGKGCLGFAAGAAIAASRHREGRLVALHCAEGIRHKLQAAKAAKQLAIAASRAHETAVLKASYFRELMPS